jgi:hypothetical protein
MSDDRVDSLSDFIEHISGLRKAWELRDDRELWFRGESKKHSTFLHPELYRPRENSPLKPVPELLALENRLYEDFGRLANQLRNEKISEEDWDWDSYFLMQHHGAPTRLLDWSDGSLMALHFAVRNKGKNDPDDALIYVLEPYRLKEQIEALPEIETVKTNWKAYVQNHQSDDLAEDEWERSYLPADDEDLRELSIPRVPLLLEFQHITRRVAAQRSRFMVFGTEPPWLAQEFEKPDSPLRAITIDASSCYKIRVELRDSGVTESVIFPDLDGLGRELKQLWDDQK